MEEYIKQKYLDLVSYRKPHHNLGRGIMLSKHLDGTCIVYNTGFTALEYSENKTTLIFMGKCISFQNGEVISVAPEPILSNKKIFFLKPKIQLKALKYAI